jgi:hypothetical protein
MLASGKLVRFNVSLVRQSVRNARPLLLAEFDQGRIVSYEGCNATDGRNFYIVSLIIRFLPIVQCPVMKYETAREALFPSCRQYLNTGHRRLLIASDVPSAVWIMVGGMADRFFEFDRRCSLGRERDSR